MKHKKTSPSPKHAHSSHKFESKEFVHHPKNQFWYIGVGLILVVAFVLALQAKDYLIMAVVLAAGLAVFRLANLNPDNKKIEVTNKGIYWGNSFIGYHQIKGFWATEIGGSAHVYLDQINFRPTINFILPESKVEKVLSTLSHHLPFHPQRSEPLSDRLNRLLRL